MAAPDFGPNIVAMFQRSCARGKDRPFLWCKRDGEWRSWSWERVAREAEQLAACLADLRIEPGDRVVLIAESRPEWAIADLAIMAAGAVTVPAYTTNTTADHAYILGHSEAKAVILSGRHLAPRVLPAVRQSPGIAAVIAMDPIPQLAEIDPETLFWDDALARGAAAPSIEARTAAIAKDDTACIIYTSGTGGRPKGVMLSHGNVLANMRGCHALLQTVGLDDEVFLSFLPLSHSYEHTAGHVFPMAIGAQIYYAESVESLTSNLVEVRPTIMTCVPRLYEVMRQRIVNGVARKGGLGAKLFHKAIDLGSRRQREPDSLGVVDRLIDRALERLVRDKVRARFGGRVKALVSGGAPLNYEVGMFFTALGLPLLQGYGQTEASPVVSANPPGRVRIETVGPPLEGVEVRIAEDGEILVRGELVMQGYWKDEIATRATIRDGWLHTGDVGIVDADGYITITDRKKDIIVNSGGDNVSPQRVEGILGLQEEIAQAVVYGDRRPHLVALIVPDAEFAARFARGNGQSPDLAALARDAAFQRAVGEAVKRANQDLSAIERVRRFHVVAEPFTVDNGMMTPTLKLRRHVIYERFGDVVEALYAPAKGERAGAA